MAPEPELSASGVLVLFIFYPTAHLIYDISKICSLPKVSYWMTGVAGAISFTLSAIYFLRHDRYKQIIKQFENEDRDTRYLTDAVVVVLWILIIIWIFKR